MSQPGSSVVTSLIEGEAKKKQVLLLEVQADPENLTGRTGAAPRFPRDGAPVHKQIFLVDAAR